MQYIGIQTQIWRNNFRSTLLLLGFPALILFLSWIFFFVSYWANAKNATSINLDAVNAEFAVTIPWVTIAVLIWFAIAYKSHTYLIEKATGAKPLERKENKEIYNLVENLAISQGMTMPKINIIEDDSLNAFASGLNKETYTITFSRGIINKLKKDELEAVAAHELSHIKNRDVRLLIISIVFVGIFAFVSEMAFRSLRGSNRGNKKNGGGLLLIAVLALIGYLLSICFKFALSQKREYMADAGSAEITRNPEALASALEKISQDSRIEAVKRKDVAQMFIDNPQEKKSSFFSLFATHPPIEERIRLLRQF